ncbi:MAG: recombinase family protein [Epulopiscium sp.]|nr:recombinase family protein [Candidatus Epulonipiscium sp.]
MEKVPYRIAAYARISVDDDLDNENVSIEHQKAIMKEYIEHHFPNATVTYFEDRDMSGYTFAQRPSYQNMKARLLVHEFDILVVKDFSRFGRRNSLGLVELENFRDNGIRVISIGDGVDYPTNNDWLMIQFRFLMNEIPVTETSKKIRDVIRKRQKDGDWICNCPYGYYLHPTKKGEIVVDEEGAEVVREIFQLYNQGWGYKKIANYLTDHNRPTGLMLMEKQLRQKGEDTSKIQKRMSTIWSHVTVAKIVKNDFYIGTLRQNIWSRAGINKKDVRVARERQLVFENHHQAIVDKKVFEKAQQLAKQRSVTHYRGERKYPIPYSGYLYCADCGSPMFSISQPKRPPAYVCGLYHKRGLKGCTSHHIREEALNNAVKEFIRKVGEHFQTALVEMDMERNQQEQALHKEKLEKLKKRLEEIKQELKYTNKERIRQLAVRPQEEDSINETFDEIIREYEEERRQTEEKIGYVSNIAQKRWEWKESIRNVLTTLEELLQKEQFTREEIGLIAERITVDSQKIITVYLKADMDELFAITKGET